MLNAMKASLALERPVEEKVKFLPSSSSWEEGRGEGGGARVEDVPEEEEEEEEELDFLETSAKRFKPHFVEKSV